MQQPSRLLKPALQFIRSRPLRLAVMAILGTALLMALFLYAITPAKYTLALGQVPPKTIVASKDVVDEITTEKNRRRAADLAPNVYKFQEGVTAQVLDRLERVRLELGNVRLWSKEHGEENAPHRLSADNVKTALGMVTAMQLQSLQLQSVLSLSDQAFDDLFVTLKASLHNTMQTNITQGQESIAINGIMQMIGYKADINTLQNVVGPVLRAVIMPNMVIDAAATELSKKAAMDMVEPVIYQQGQNIIRRGEGRIEAHQLKMLEDLGLIRAGGEGPSSLGAIVLMLLVMLLFHLLLLSLSPHVFTYSKRLVVMYITLLVTMSLCVAAKKTEMIYLAPLLFAPMLLSLTLGRMAALLSNVVCAVLAGFILAIGGQHSTGDLIYILVSTLLSGSLVALLLHNASQRFAVLLSGTLAAVVQFVCMLATGHIISRDMAQVMQNALWALGGGALSTLLCLGLVPLFETLFNLPTQARLLDLCNPSQPLLTELLTHAPGTYHHSLIIGNLAEASAKAIGANPLLARAGGYYHDIGKLRKPIYFKENQFNASNVHDALEPRVSAAIITAHVQDGLKMARQYRLPLEIQEIIHRHHGNSLVRFFYEKAKQQDGTADENDYRYKAPLPATKETGIVMLCDTIEAAVRSLKSPTKEDIQQFIQQLIHAKIDDGLLKDTPLTANDLTTIAATCTSVLVGVFHERIEYPEKARRPKKPWLDAAAFYRPLPVEPIEKIVNQEDTAHARPENDAHHQS